MLVTSLGTSGAGARQIKNVEVLGHRRRIEWSQQPGGLSVQLPAERPSEYAVTLRIE